MIIVKRLERTMQSTPHIKKIPSMSGDLLDVFAWPCVRSLYRHRLLSAPTSSAQDDTALTVTP